MATSGKRDIAKLYFFAHNIAAYFPRISATENWTHKNSCSFIRKAANKVPFLNGRDIQALPPSPTRS